MHKGIVEGMFSSSSVEWSTPQWLFDELDNEFHFTLDLCSTHENHKCDKYYTETENGLLQDWQGETVYCNPPYGKQISQWVEKCYREGTKDNTTVVMLIPARTDTAYFHDFILNRSEIRFVPGRLCFNDGNGRSPFASIVVIFRGAKVRTGFANKAH